MYEKDTIHKFAPLGNKCYPLPYSLWVFDMKINEKIKQLREVRQWTQEEMAQKLNMTTKGYAKIERGETLSNLPRLEQIAEIFGMHICQLLSYGEEGNLYAGNASQETEMLRLILLHKEELLAHKNEIIENQKRELLLLREMIESLKKQ